MLNQNLRIYESLKKHGHPLSVKNAEHREENRVLFYYSINIATDKLVKTNKLLRQGNSQLLKRG